MAHISRPTKIVIAFVVIVVAGFAAAIFWQSQNKIPQSFTDARTQGAAIAQNIVNISNQSNATLAEVNADDQKGDYADALKLVSGMVAQSQDLRNQAVQLSNQVQAMTQALSGVGSIAAQQSALEAISSHLALINQLINYSGDLGNLLDALQARFSGQSTKANIASLVNQINTDVNAINNFNSQAQQAMQQFDKITGQ